MNAQRNGGVSTSGNNTSLSVTSGKASNASLKKLFIAMSGLLVTTVCLQNTAFAATHTESLQQQVSKLEKQLTALNKKVNKKVSKANYASKTQYAVGGNSYIYTDSHGPKKFEQLSSADIPLSLLKMKNMYPQKSLALGGLFEFEPVNSWFGDDLGSGYQHGTASSVSDVNFDAMMNVNDYTQVFTQFAYTGGDGNISLMSGFVTFGNLAKSPFFASVGKFRPRFGVFPGGPYYATIPQGIFRPGHLVNTTVGYSHDNLDVYVSFLPTGASATDSKGNKQSLGRKNGAMVSAFYSGQLSKAVSYGVNAGYVTDVVSTGSSVGKAVAQGAYDNTDYKKVPAADVDANVSVGPVNLSGGYQTTTKKTYGLTDNGKKAKASSYYAQVAYSVTMYDKPVTFAVNYSKAKNTQNVAMPLGGDINNGPAVKGIEKQLGGYAMVNVNKSLAVGLEYARMKTYTGQHSDEVTLYGAVYF